jgi:hypothetical protein
MHLRMSPQLRESLRDAANTAGCSLNAFAVQVLSAAAGDAAGFRTVDEQRSHSAPLAANQSWRRSQARSNFIGVMGMEIGSVAMAALVQRYDVEDPGYFLEWQRARDGDAPGEPGASRSVA